MTVLRAHVTALFEYEAGIALAVAIYSAIRKQPVLPGMLIIGDLSIQGNIKPLRSLAELLQVGIDNGMPGTFPHVQQTQLHGGVCRYR